MIIDNNHLYLLCGTNRWSYNTDVYDIHLPTLRSTHIGNTFDETEGFAEGGRQVLDEEETVLLTLCTCRYRQEAYLFDNQIFLFGGGGSSGIAFSLQHVSEDA